MIMMLCIAESLTARGCTGYGTVYSHLKQIFPPDALPSGLLCVR